MKLIRAHANSQVPDPKPARVGDSEISNLRSQGWVKLMLRGSALVAVFLAGILFARAGGAAMPATPPTVHGLAVITSTVSVRVPAITLAATPQPAFGEALPTIYINVPATNWDQITAARERALKRGILLNEDNPEVDGTLRYNNRDMPIKIALKGDWTDHLRGEKWSLRIKMDNNYFLFGMAVFAIQNPPVRQYTNEWAYHTNLKRDGVLGLRYQFVNVVLNGQPKGIYALEEGFSKELFEAQQRREGFIMRYNENLMWTWRSLSANRYVPPGVETFHLIDEYQTNKLVNAQGLGAQRQMAEGMLRSVWTGDLRASDVFDVNLMGRFLALTDLWGGQHGLIWHNLRYYYNPLSTRIEPIGFNANALDVADTDVDLDPNLFYDDPFIQIAFVKSALEVTSPAYLEKLEADLTPQMSALNQALSDEFGELPLPWDKLRTRAQELRQRLQPYQTIYAYSPLGDSNAIDVGNFTGWPVQVVGMETDGRWIPFERSWVTAETQQLLVPDMDTLALLALASDATDVAYARIRIPQDVISLTATAPITVVTRLVGGIDQQHQPVLRRYPLPVDHTVQPVATVEQALAQHPFLERGQDADWLQVKRGDWTVKNDLVMPKGYGLRIGPGTTLRFGQGVIMVAYGPLLFEGEPDAPILLTRAEDTDLWGGIAIVEANAPSAWSYVTFEYTGGLSRPGWGTTGGLNLYKSPARLDHCRFMHIRNTDDVVNFVISPFEVVDSYFEDSDFDAIDSDFSATGLVERCAFYKIGNDGLDMSGTKLTARQLTMTDMGDKGASIGEFSEADLEDIVVTHPYIGIAVKDGSHVTVRNVKISQPLIAGLAAYTKKTEYGPAGMTATGIVFENVERPTLVQTGNWIDLDGQRVWGVDVDIEKLYLPFTKQK
jgi:hypothetical protein